MSRDSDFPVPASMAARLGSDLLLSLGIATAIALLVTVPAFLSDAASERAQAPALVMLRDGKIADRLADIGQVGEADLVTGRPLTPAALAMPMLLAWPEEGDWTPPRAAVQAKAPVAISVAALPSRRLAELSVQKRRVMSPPMTILTPVATAAAETAQAAELSGGEPETSSLRQFVVAPAMKVADAVSGAAGSMQAAGSWTLTQASGLLPRW